jgi:hypothetical protein
MLLGVVSEYEGFTVLRELKILKGSYISFRYSLNDVDIGKEYEEIITHFISFIDFLLYKRGTNTFAGLLFFIDMPSENYGYIIKTLDLSQKDFGK